MLNWPVLKRAPALAALNGRIQSIRVEIDRLAEIRIEQQPLPDHVEMLFDYTLGQLRTEARWLEQSVEYMAQKPWLEEREVR